MSVARRSVRRVLVVGALVAIAMVGWTSCGSEGEPTGTVVVREPSIDEPINGSTAALRMIIDNSDGPEDRLLSASTPAVGTVVLHESETDDVGRATMTRLEGIVIPAGDEVFFVPGSYHVMLSDLTAPLAVGDLVPVTLEFERAGSVTVQAPVKPLGVNGG